MVWMPHSADVLADSRPVTWQEIRSKHCDFGSISCVQQPLCNLIRGVSGL